MLEREYGSIIKCPFCKKIHKSATEYRWTTCIISGINVSQLEKFYVCENETKGKE